MYLPRQAQVTQGYMYSSIIGTNTKEPHDTLHRLAQAA